MLTTLTISLREFLEVFLIIGVFLGISRKLNIKREREILLASFLGIVISLILPITVFFLGDRAKIILTEKNADLLESYLMIFSGFFIAYVIFSIHKMFAYRRSSAVILAHNKLEQNIFDVSLFLTIVFFIVREGFEIALFTATTSLFTRFSENVIGLSLGLAISGAIGAAAFLTYIKFSVGRVFKLTEYLIVLLGATFVKNGLTNLLRINLNIDLSVVMPINLGFLPTDSTFVGHILKNIFGMEQDFSLAKLFIMACYIFIVYLLFFRKRAVHGKISQ